MASKQTSKTKLREAIYKKLVANPDGYLGLRDKLNYAKLLMILKNQLI